MNAEQGSRQEVSTLIASLLVGANAATSKSGSSAPLRTLEDRERFLALRNSPEISAIIVGGATALVEPYQRSPHPLYIYSREVKAPLKMYVSHIRREISGTLLCEGGVRVIHQLLHDDLIDTFLLSRVEIHGDGHYLDEPLLQKSLILRSSERVGSTTFERYERASR